MDKIVIIGAGIGGLITAYDLGSDGYDITIYEKNKEDEMSYDWYDDATPQILRKYDIPFPNKDAYFIKPPWAFVPPFSTKALEIQTSEENCDYSFQRRELSKHLINRTKKYAKIEFETPVDKLIINNDKVEGIVVSGKEIKADLVVDSSGVMSKFRSNLPESFGIEKDVGKGGSIHTYRAFYDRKNEFTPDLNHKIYLKHLGKVGISWFRCDFDNEVDIFVGLIDKLGKSDIDIAIEQLRKDNPSLGDKMMHGGDRNIIPIRYPLTKMVGDGYVAIGDCAFMTIPLMGSGIGNTITAGKILAKTIKKGVNKENLWNYQLEYFKEVGAENMAIDSVKRWLLKTDSEDIKFLFESGIISDKELALAGDGGKIKLSLKEMLGKLKIGYKKLGLLISLVKTLKGMDKITALGNAIPKVYNEEQITNWENKIKKFYSKI